VSVERGQSLDALIRKHLAASPLKVEVLRDLVHQMNPQAFAAGGGHRLLSGVRLQLPTMEDQMRHAFGKAGLTVASTREELVESAAGPWGNGAAAARRGWVRYP
jgi:Tfp pilus assembly protein FimV